MHGSEKTKHILMVFLPQSLYEVLLKKKQKIYKGFSFIVELHLFLFSTFHTFTTKGISVSKKIAIYPSKKINKFIFHL